MPRGGRTRADGAGVRVGRSVRGVRSIGPALDEDRVGGRAHVPVVVEIGQQLRIVSSLTREACTLDLTGVRHPAGAEARSFSALA